MYLEDDAMENGPKCFCVRALSGDGPNCLSLCYAWWDREEDVWMKVKGKSGFG
jgi:hypothetical protein